ncbi:MAG: energy transducer TonB [Bacteroidota bacterium]
METIIFDCIIQTHINLSDSNMSIIDQLKRRQSSPLFPLIPFLFLFAVIFSKSQNREYLRGQIDSWLTDEVRDLTKAYQEMDEQIEAHLDIKGGLGYNFIHFYQEQVDRYPEHEMELTLMAGHLAKWYGGEMVRYNQQFGTKVSAYGIGDHIMPNVDQLPHFGECKTLSELGRVMCSEQQIHQFIFDHLVYPNVDIEEGITIEATVLPSGQLSDVAAIVSQDADASMKEAALRVVRSMPKWQPALRNGKPVACKIYLPIIINKNAKPDWFRQPLDTQKWVVDAVPPRGELSWQGHRDRLERLLEKYNTIDFNSGRHNYAVLFSRAVRAALKDADMSERLDILNLVTASTTEYGIPLNIMTNADQRFIDATLTVIESPEPSYADEDKIYVDLMEIMEDYEPEMSEAAELAIERSLGDLMWDFINRFPDHTEMAQAALQHACNLKKVSTHTVAIKKEAAEVRVNLKR